MRQMRLSAGRSSSAPRARQPRGAAAPKLCVGPDRPQPPPYRLVVRAGAPAAASTEEEAANRKRWEESGGSQGSVDEWRWSLNWDAIQPYSIVVGACPRSAEDIDRIVEEAGCNAILSLQSDLCLEALQIDYPAIRARAIARGMLATRTAVRDFDHQDQAFGLPEAVRMLYTLLSMGKKVYVHCTAGINRATLTVVGYLTFVLGMELEEAEALVKAARPQAHPYIDCWRTVRARLVEARTEEVAHLARSRHASRVASATTGGEEEDGDGGVADWVAAENMLIKETFQRQLTATLTLVGSIEGAHALELSALSRAADGEATSVAEQIRSLREGRDKERIVLESTLEELAMARAQLAELRACGVNDDSCGFDLLTDAQQEIASLRVAIQEVRTKTSEMLRQGLSSDAEDAA